MTTEKEKMLAGQPFKTGDTELMNDKKNARILAEKYNHSSEEDSDYRKTLLKQLFGKCGEKILIKPPFHCDYGYQISIGENFLANFDCVFLDAAPIEIGNNCMIGPKTCIYAISHPLNPEERQEGIGVPGKVTIGNDVWIGGGVTILPGVSLGNNVVVGAGSVVTRSFPNNVVIAGNPARVIKTIPEKNLISIANEKDEIVGTHVRGEPLPTGHYPMIAAVLLLNSKGNLVLQKIAAHKKWGGLWTYSAAGHVDAGETYRIAAQRELKEEMGVEAEIEQEVAAFPVIREGRQIAFHHVFLARSDAPITPDESEVAEIREISLDSLKDELKQYPERFFDAFTTAIKQYLKI